MPTGIIFNLPGASGHINPTVGLVEALCGAGHRIVYYAGEDSRRTIEQRGAEFRTYAPYFDYHHNAAAAGSVVDMAMVQLELAERCLEGLRSDLQALSPDYILYDSCCMWGKMLARALGLPAVCLITTVVSTPLLMLADARFTGGIVGEMAIKLPTRLLRARRQLRAMLASMDLPYHNIVHHAFDVFANEGDLNLVFLAPSFQPFSSRLDASRFVFCGASVPAGRDADSLGPIKQPGRPLVYISLGTVHNLRDAFYRQCFEAFADQPLDVIMSVGAGTRLEELGEPPANVRVFPRVPQLEVLGQADAFVSHGGMNSINESMYFGVPMVMVPQQIEQRFNARRIERAGAGLHLSPAAVSAQRLRSAVQRLLHESTFRQAAQTLQRELHATGGYQRAAREIMARVDATPAGSASPPGAAEGQHRQQQ